MRGLDSKSRKRDEADAPEGTGGRERDIVRANTLLMVVRTTRATFIATGVERSGEVFSVANRSGEHRHEDGANGTDAVGEATLLEGRASCCLGIHD